VQVVMHLGAWLRGGPEHVARRINVEATRSLAEASSRFGVDRFVFTSSIAVYGPHGDLDVDEQTDVRPYGSPYGDSKILAEIALHEVSERDRLPVVIVRPGMVYGPGSPGWTVRIARWAKAGRLPLIDGGRGTAYPIYITNLIDLLVLCVTHPAAIGQTFNAVDDGPVTLAAFLGAYMRMVPTDRAIRLPGWLVSAAARTMDALTPGQGYSYLASQLRGRGQVLNHRAKELVGWQPRISLEEGLRCSEQWLRDEGLL
jgi:nucleoside-diphosphate-sugar epimerase